MTYNASLDKTAKVITIAVLLLSLGISLYSIYGIVNAVSGSEVILHVIIILFFLIFTISVWAYSPKGYEVKNQSVVVLRKAGNIVIPFREIAVSTTLEERQMKGTIRTFGVGGFFGYFGKFRVPGLGSTTLYTTQMRNFIHIGLKNGKNIIITPDDTSLLSKIR